MKERQKQYETNETRKKFSKHKGMKGMEKKFKGDEKKASCSGETSGKLRELDRILEKIKTEVSIGKRGSLREMRCSNLQCGGVSKCVSHTVT